MRRLTWLAVVMVMAAGLGAYAGPTEEEKIEAVIAAVLEAHQLGDAAALGRHHAPEVTVVPAYYNPLVSGWANVEQDYRRAYANYSGVRITRENTRIVRRGKLAWATYQWQLEGVAGQRTIEAQGHTTLILEKREGQWVILHNHTSAVPPPRPPATPTAPKPSS